MIPVLVWEKAPDAPVYALKRYVPRMATLRQLKSDSRTKAENDYAYGFKTGGKHADDVEHCFRCMAEKLGCSEILAVPPSSVGGQPNACQRIFGVKIRRTLDAEARKYNHNKPIPDGHENTYVIENVARGKKYLLVDDICTTGRTLLHYKSALEAMGAAVEIAAVGIHHKLELTLADFGIEPMKEDDSKIYPSLMAALNFLQDQGFDLKKSKLYKDRKDGLLRMEADGRSVRESEVLSYAVKAGLKRRVDIDARALEEAADRKARAEIRKLEASARMTEFDLEVKQGKYILKEDAVRARIDQMAILEINFRQLVETKLPEWIAACGGTQKRLNDLRDMAALSVDDMMNALARSDTFSVVYDDAEGGI